MRSSKVMMFLAAFLATLACWASQTSKLVASRDAASKPVRLNVWHADLNKCKSYAKSHGVPLIAVWSNGEACPHCVDFESACNATYFKNWMKKSGCVFLFVYSGDKNNQNVFDFCYGGQALYPLIRVWWYKDGKKKLDTYLMGDTLDGTQIRARGLKNVCVPETLRMKAKVIPSASEAASLDSSGGWGGEQLLFAKGKVAMLITGRYMVTAFRQNYKNLDFGIAHFPKAPCPNNLLLSKSYCIPKTSRNRDQAIQFIVHLTGLANQNLVADYGDGVPSMNTPEIIQNFLFNPDYPKETENQNVLDDLKGAKPQERSLYISSTDFNQIWSLEVGKVWLG